MNYLNRILILALLTGFYGTAQNLSKSFFTIGRIHYKGGGDWYGNKTSLSNMLRFFEKTTGIPVREKEVVVELDQPFFYNFPVLYIAGHGNINFSNTETKNLRQYLMNGGFLFADDDYGMDKYFRREMKKVFPEFDFIEINYDDLLFKKPFRFPDGPPKIHEHAGGPPQAFGLYVADRLVCIYTFNTDISDGCEDEGIHNDSKEVRTKAIKFSSNILYRALTQ